jgi:hypothetical protein
MQTYKMNTEKCNHQDVKLFITLGLYTQGELRVFEVRDSKLMGRRLEENGKN